MSIIFLFLLTCKHAVADLWLQSHIEYRGGKINLRNGRLLLHCAQHAVLTFFVALVFVGIVNAMWLSLLDFVAHFVIDYGKSQYQKYTGVKHGTKRYWLYSTVDQCLHYATYLVIVLIA